MATQYKLTAKVSEKGAVSVIGMGRFPTTLYADQWRAIVAAGPAILKFIEANKDKLAVKADKVSTSANALN